jgi:Holliday junction resolvasome RuvABC endonuclease subunit
MINAYTVVGIDQSLTGTGLAIIHNDKTIMAPEAPRFSTTKIKPTVRGVHRLMYIEEVVNRWIPPSADLCVMEGYAFAAHGQAFGLGECGGTIKRCVHLKDKRLIVVAPGTLKKYVTGSGAAKKNVMLLHAFKKFGTSFEEDDECDAYCLARLGMEYLAVEAGGDATKAFMETYKAVQKYNIKLAGGEIDE